MKQSDNTHLAELNIATAVDDLESERLADSVAALDSINALAERSPGFVWRLKDESGNATDIRASDDPRTIVNLGVWETPEDLENFVWNTVHKRIYAERPRWFISSKQAHFVMWWVRVGHIPTIDEALERLSDLQTNGATERAFGWEALPNVKLWQEQRCA